MRYVVLLVIVLVGGALAVVVIQNFSTLATAVHLSFFIWRTPALPMGLWLLISCLFGALMLYIFTLVSAWQERRELRTLRRRVAELEQAQVSMSSGPVQMFPSTHVVPMPGIPGRFPPTPPQ